VRHVLALDQGTTSSRAILFNEHGAPVAMAQREFRQIYPDLGWVEHDPKEIFRTQRDVAREVVQKAKVSLNDVMAVGITNQRETTLLWDRQTGEPLHNAIVWQDRRTAPMCDELKQVGAESLVAERTGLVIDPYFSGTKLAWLLDEIPGALQHPRERLGSGAAEAAARAARRAARRASVVPFLRHIAGERARRAADHRRHRRRPAGSALRPGLP